MKNKYDLQELVYIPHIKKWGIVEDIKFQYHFPSSKHINVYTVNYATPMPEHTYAMKGRRIDVDEDLIEKKDFLEKMNKFKLNDSVVVNVEGMEKKGIVVGSFCYYAADTAPRREYDVSYEHPKYADHGFGVLECVSLRSTGRFKEVDLKSPLKYLEEDFVFNPNLTTEQMLEGYIKELEKSIYKSFGIDPDTLFPKTDTDDSLDDMKYALATRTLTSNVIYDSPHNYEINDIDIRLLRAKDIPIKQCLNGHKWKTYEGFTSKYDYCEHCDEKKDLND